MVKIGFAAPFTGDQAIVGIPMRCCAELAIRQANESGQLPCEVRLQAEDDRAEPLQAEAVARRLVDDPAVIGVVGHKNSGPSEAAAPIYQAAGLAQLTPSSTNSHLSQQGFQTFFRLCAPDAVQGRVAAQYAVRVLGVRQAAVIHDQTGYGRPLAEVVRAALGQEEAEVVLFEGIRQGATDFSQTVGRIRELSPDLVYFALTEIESALLSRQLRAARVEALLFGTDGSRESQFLPLAGEAAEGVYQTYAGVDPERVPAARPFVEAFRARYGPVPVYGAEVYDATNLLLAALARAGANVERIGNSLHRPPEAEKIDRRRILQKIGRLDPFEGATGPIRFEPNGDRRDPQVSMWRVTQGEMQWVGLARDLIPE